MKFIIITLFPEMFEGFLSCSILKRAQEKGHIEVEFINLRDFGLGKRKQVDDTPYGGGAGMVLRVDVVAKAIESAKSIYPNAKTILLTPQGETFDQQLAGKLTKEKGLILICGHYEGFDERIRALVDQELSIGQYILTGGELAAGVVIDTVARLIPGTLGKVESIGEETYMCKGQIEYPQYTKPEEWKGQKVPDVLLSGHHQKISEWRKAQSDLKTKKTKKIKLVDGH
ncbi:MAG: tRNA (guanosine(37)-N1)-methyltransferase TrmD [Patescibacteria group bacterium]|nr:tRNA (guanosine(37)-N1)-methyltransferase TrmD [Patescibacteria group bacterium]